MKRRQKPYRFKSLRNYNSYDSNRKIYTGLAITIAIVLVVGIVCLCASSAPKKEYASHSQNKPIAHSQKVEPEHDEKQNEDSSYVPSDEKVPTRDEVIVIPEEEPEPSIPDSISEPSGLSHYAVDRVIDGDTIRVFADGGSVKVRLIGIDTPETVHPRKPVECYGPQASNYAKNIMTGKTVALEFDPSQGSTDYYGRWLAYVYVDGYQVNYDMVINGYGNEYTYDSRYKYQSEFKAAEDEAREQSYGLWSSSTCSGSR